MRKGIEIIVLARVKGDIQSEQNNQEATNYISKVQYEGRVAKQSLSLSKHTYVSNGKQLFIGRK